MWMDFVPATISSNSILDEYSSLHINGLTYDELMILASDISLPFCFYMVHLNILSLMLVSNNQRHAAAVEVYSIDTQPPTVSGKLRVEHLSCSGASETKHVIDKIYRINIFRIINFRRFNYIGRNDIVENGF